MMLAKRNRSEEQNKLKNKNFHINWYVVCYRSRERWII